MRKLNYETDTFIPTHKLVFDGEWERVNEHEEEKDWLKDNFWLSYVQSVHSITDNLTVVIWNELDESKENTQTIYKTI